ncbi:MAG: LacI family DNA-binding transcriptional regulator [Novosphingobium sp.]|nr:LacI family DNA-binding transcriptional regulator [Novosphingobium sp.]
MANIKDIAAHAGVSIATVSRALRKPDLVKDKTAAKIAAAISELGYKPNMVAASLRRQKADAVIVAVPDIHNPFTSLFVQGVENVAREHGVKVLLAITEGRQDLLDLHYEMVAGKQADGMIVLDVNLPTAIRTQGEDGRTLPIVLVCEYAEASQQPRVRVDDLQAAIAAANHIASLGHRDIACIAGPERQRMSHDRQRGFRLGLRRAGIELHEALVERGDYSIRSGFEATRRLLEQGRPFTALLCENDEMAIGAIRALALDGLSVPGDVSVIGIDNLRFAEFCNPSLTTIALSTDILGEEAMRLMLDYDIDPEIGRREVIVPHELIVRDSTAAPRGQA